MNQVNVVTALTVFQQRAVAIIPHTPSSGSEPTARSRVQAQINLHMHSSSDTSWTHWSRRACAADPHRHSHYFRGWPFFYQSRWQPGDSCKCHTDAPAVPRLRPFPSRSQPFPSSQAWAGVELNVLSYIRLTYPN